MTYNDYCEKLTQEIQILAKKNESVFWLLLLVVLSVPLYPLFRKSPAIPDLRYSELIITLVYIYDMFAIYNIIFSFFCIPDGFDEVVYLLPAIPLKQLSGFKWWRTILYLILSYISWFIAFIGMVLAIGAILYYAS